MNLNLQLFVFGRTITTRPITPADEPALLEIYASTRAEELAQVDWSAEQKQPFVAQQFAAQHAHYQQYYPGAAFLLIEVDGVTAGRLYLAHWPRELRIIDISLLPEQRNQGLGSAFLRAILAEGARLGLPVSIHVERFNPALRLYQRLGFAIREDKGVYLLMECQPEVIAHA
ncbi:MAG: GNAT family N-acetyltransferase [Roseiflexaceae bacterium]|nr:GNAT family N-acetyltransferase [Roseiflexaceae bacterium]